VPSSLGDALAAHAARHREPATVVVVSDCMAEPAAIDAGLGALRARRHAVVLLQVLGAGELDPARDFTHGVLADVESGATHPIALTPRSGVATTRSSPTTSRPSRPPRAATASRSRDSSRGRRYPTSSRAAGAARARPEAVSVLGVANPLGAAALVAVAALIALHLWDRRRRVVPVSTLFLWRRIPAAPLERRRRLRPDALFALQLARCWSSSRDSCGRGSRPATPRPARRRC
jgi:hypothetical protein